MKVTKVESGVYFIEKGTNLLKLSKVKNGWAIILNQTILVKCDSKKAALEIIKAANI